MSKKIRFYGQHNVDDWNPSMETCGAACVLMLLDYYDRITYPTRKMERKLYSKYHVNCYKGMTGAAVANCLSFPGNELDVHLVQSFWDKMDNRDGYFPDTVYEKIMDSHTMHLNACKDRIKLSTGMEFDIEYLKQELKMGKKIILECFIPEVEDGPPSVLHWVILEKYDIRTGLFRIRDPNTNVKLLHLTDAELDTYMDTPIGRICIIVEDVTT